MSTYTILYHSDPAITLTATEVPVVNDAPNPPPNGYYTAYKHNNKVVMEISTSDEIAAVKISPPSGGNFSDQSARIGLATDLGKSTSVEWTRPTGAIRIEAQTNVGDTSLRISEGRPLVALKVTVKKQ